jgi:DedD protein
VAKTPISNEELQLRKRARRRLVGAILLVLLVVVLVPMFLEHEPRLQKQDMDIRIPPVPGQTLAPSFPGAGPAPAAPAAVPVEKAQTPEQPTTQPSAPPAAPSAAPAEAPTAPAAQRQSESAANPPSPAPSKEASAQPAAADGFVIQLGAFANASNARELLQQIRAHKFPAYTELVKSAQGEKTRVRVGPYPSVEVAEKARDRLKALKLVAVSEARVVRVGE